MALSPMRGNIAILAFPVNGRHLFVPHDLIPLTYTVDGVY